MDTTWPVLAALWLGILTAISPCPLATNIAAVSFISRQVSHRTTVILSGVAYTIGRAITYGVLGYVLVRTAVDVPALSMFLQTHINRFLGIVLALVGMFLLDLIPIHLPSLDISGRVAERLGQIRMGGPLLLGSVFALAFCPVSAALFFGGVIPLAVQNRSSFVLPLSYSIGTGLPVLAFAVVIAVSAGSLGKVYKGVSRMDQWSRRITGIIFIGIGVYYILRYTFEIL